jgi:receptor protein-tyrosine kinase
VLSLLDESGLPTHPINAPNLKSTLIKGCILGGFLWCVIVLVFALSKTTIHNEDMLRKLLNLDCYGQVPTVKVAGKDSCPLIHRGRKKPEFSEAIRSVRMRVERAMEGEEKKVLLVSSAIPGEGKTTVSVNLGAALARRGKRVLIVDCDLRNPSVAKGLKIQSNLALPDYLNGKATIKEVICETDQENLYVITGGPGGAGYTHLLTRERGELLIHAARNLYDYVILDTPPCSMLSDAGEVAALADAGLLVVRQDYASRDQILDGVQRLGDADLSMIGWVFNHTRRSLSYSYSYNHVYNYGGGYAYNKKSK